MTPIVVWLSNKRVYMKKGLEGFWCALNQKNISGPLYSPWKIIINFDPLGISNRRSLTIWQLLPTTLTFELSDLIFWRKICFTGKNQNFRKFRSIQYTTGTTFELNFLIKTRYRRSETDHGGFQQQSPQRLVDRYEHMNSRNKRYDLFETHQSGTLFFWKLKKL